MCGICGIINFNNEPVQEAPVRRMMQIQKHRGPDDEGVFLEDNVGLGFVRLSIIDLSSAGHQPMFSYDDRYVIVYNGEIFNYIELRDELKASGHIFLTNSDTEVLLAAYIEWGEKCLEKFNGMWSFVIYDRTGKSIFGSRDRYGIKPFYYYLTDKMFAFASEIPPLLTLLPGKPEPDNQMIFDYLVFNRTDHTERTFFKGIKKIQHGHNVTLDVLQGDLSGNPAIDRWYNLREQVKHTQGFTSPGEFRDLFSDSVGLRLRSDVPVGVCLSGGLDSSAITSVILKDYGQQDINTFSAVYNKGQTGDETEFIMEFRNQLPNMFFTTPDADSLFSDLNGFIKAHAEPMPTTSPYAQFSVMQLASKNVVVTLDGQGADEILAGYHYFYGYLFKDLLKHARIKDLATEMYHYFRTYKSFYGFKTFAFFMLPSNLRTWTRVREKRYLKKEFVSEFSSRNTIAENLYGSGSLQDALIDHFEYKLEHLLKWEDRNSMWFSIEARIPFLDHRLVEKALASTRKSFIYKGVTKRILRDAMKESIPKKILERKDKVGFDTPQSEWLKTDRFKKVIQEIFEEGGYITNHLIEKDTALALYSDYCKGNRDLSKEVFKWVNLELWSRSFINE